MKLKCFGCDAIITEDVAMVFGGHDWCIGCHEDLGRDFEEMEKRARQLQSLIETEIQQLTR